MIPAGSQVIIRTNNGGEIVGKLVRDYRSSFEADIGLPEGSIPGWRIKSVEKA